MNEEMALEERKAKRKHQSQSQTKIKHVPPLLTTPTV